MEGFLLTSPALEWPRADKFCMLISSFHHEWLKIWLQRLLETADKYSILVLDIRHAGCGTFSLVYFINMLENQGSNSEVASPEAYWEISEENNELRDI
jgi:hypothetical protein